ncbi:NAD(P)/FAD-dependent oxidoreductase [uncultured Selenomonas sp.]|uniref:NAD(P)/FAD-dependent oxidoreductase n=1 Tax=uncultured Selenomonas sp. TaxID=159275 RepID=UPI0028D4AE5A|nr:NAD(P)/FAD-dependent oxidoreductase [uncultured Selenomonas sp.]
MADRKHIIIVGAGFGGVRLAKELAKENVRITLVDRHNYHLFQPLLYQVTTAVLSPAEIAYPTREFFKNNKNVEFFLGKAKGVDQARRVLLTDHGEISYDYLVLAAGGTTNFFGNESVERNSYAMKTLQEAIALRSHIVHEFERASKKTAPEQTDERRRHLNFVVVGGGATGIEMAGAMVELFDIFKKEFHSLDFREVQVTLLEAMDSVLPMVPPDLQQHTIDVLRKKGVDVRLNTAVTDYDGNDLTLKGGEVIPTKTVIWAAGVRAQGFLKDCGGEVDRSGRIIVEENLLVRGSDRIFAIGDCANFQHGTERPLPTVAPVATQEAIQVKQNIMMLIAGRAPEQLGKFVYRDLGAMATIGRGEAVMNGPMPVLGFNLKASGFFAWFAWMFVHLIRLAGKYSDFTVSVKWIWNFFFGTRVARIILSKLE